MTNNCERLRHFDGLRELHLDRSRYSASLTIPSLLPPKDYSGLSGENLPRPFSSVPAKGVISMASRLLSVMMPLTEAPFFKFRLKSGVTPDDELQNFLNGVERQVYNKLINSNLRDVVYETLQHLLVTGDVFVMMDDSYTFRLIRLDHFVVQRDPIGEPREILWLEYIPKDAEKDDFRPSTDSVTSEYNHTGFETIYARAIRDAEAGKWTVTHQNVKGEALNNGEATEFQIPPFDVIGWTHIAHEDYSRSYVEENIGDIDALESFTELLQQGLAASSAFWMGVNSMGATDIKDVANREVGSWVGAKDGDIFTISPSATLRPQVSAAQSAVEYMRREVGQLFLMTSASIPSGDRVTATAVRMIGLDLENVTGGSFGRTADRLFSFIIRRAVHQMIRDGELDAGLWEQFFTPGGELNIDILTGLEALSSDAQLNSLLQLGQVVAQSPEKAQEKFNWEHWMQQIIMRNGFDSDEFIVDDEEIQQQRAVEQGQQAAQQATQGAVQAAVPPLVEQAIQGGLPPGGSTV